MYKKYIIKYEKMLNCIFCLFHISLELSIILLIEDLFVIPSTVYYLEQIKE